MGSNPKEAVLHTPLPFHAGQVTVETSLDRYAAGFNRLDRAFDIDATSQTCPFLARSVVTKVGQTTLYAAVHTGLSYVSSVDEPFATFLLPVLGRASFRLERRCFQLAAGETAVYMPGQARHCETELAGGTLIKLSRERLAAKAAELCGDASASARYRETFERPWEFSETVPLQRQLLSVIRKTIGLIDHLHGDNQVLHADLRIEDLLYRSVVLLARPELLEV